MSRCMVAKHAAWTDSTGHTTLGSETCPAHAYLMESITLLVSLPAADLMVLVCMQVKALYGPLVQVQQTVNSCVLDVEASHMFMTIVVMLRCDLLLHCILEQLRKLQCSDVTCDLLSQRSEFYGTHRSTKIGILLMVALLQRYLIQQKHSARNVQA